MQRLKVCNNTLVIEVNVMQVGIVYFFNKQRNSTLSCIMLYLGYIVPTVFNKI